MTRVKMVVMIGLAALGAVYAGTRPEAMTREQKNKLLVAVAIGAMNEGDWQLMAKLYSPRFVQHSPGKKETIDWEEFELGRRIVRQKMPTARTEIEDIIAEGDKVAIRCKTVITFKEAPIGRWTPDGRVELREMDLYRIEGGRIVEEWCEYDTAGWQKELKKLKYVKTWK